MKKIFLSGLVVLCFAGCVSKVENMFTDTTKASSKYTNVGHINTNAPIIKEAQAQNPPVFKKIQQQKAADRIKEINHDYDMVGYIVSSQKDPDLNLYVYTFTDPLRSKRIQFFSRERLSYKPSELVSINVRDNFLINHKKYRSVTGKRTFNHYIQSAKEYFIKVK